MKRSSASRSSRPKSQAAQQAVIDLGDRLRAAEEKYRQAQEAQRSLGMLDAQADGPG